MQKWGSGRFLKPNRKIRVDFTTGEHFELGKLAPKTYEKICQETSEIKSKISDTFGSFNPRNKEASILYEGKYNIISISNVCLTLATRYFNYLLMQKCTIIQYFDNRRVG